ncbi:MAG: helix-hairpin-helix domain-containing protein [Armatimonadota bacterium]
MFEFSRAQKTVLAILALVALSGVGVQAWRTLRRPAPVVVVGGASSYLGTPGGAGRAILVHVAGAVRNPNVYEFREGDRVRDAISRAGGALPNAALDALNLAEKLSDGQKVYVPAVDPAGRTVSARTASTSASTERKASGRDRSGRPRGRSPKKLKSPSEGTVNINTADSETLQRLPGVGPAIAERIIEYRSQKGRFTAPEEIMEVRGIGPKTFAKMRALVRVE